MLDLIVIGIILLFSAVGYHKGFIKTVITLLSSVVALVLSLLMYPVINTILRFTPVYTYMNKWIAERMLGVDFGTGVQTQGNAISSNITWLPQFVSNQVVKNNNQEVYNLLHVSNVKDYISIYLTNIAVGMLAVIITWFILKVLLMFFLKTSDAIVSHLPFIATINKMGGAVAGMTKGLLTIWIICLLVPVLITHSSFSLISDYIANSYFANWLYNNNMVLMLFNSIFNI